MDANADAPPPLQEILRDGFTEDRNGVIAGCFEVFTYRHSSHSTWNQDTTVDVLQIGEQAEVTRIAGGRVVRWDDNEDWVLIRVDTELQPPLVWLPVQSPREPSRARNFALLTCPFTTTPGVEEGHSGSPVFIGRGALLFGMVVRAATLRSPQGGTCAHCVTPWFYRQGAGRTSPIWETDASTEE
ncbi:hypothetical protein PsorP6_015956 [Peronosclerospora sorghi]|uniref:Uncharacterized protein n=1 Tax=Peronosclerospora sorghi TaxID=230839 RepID=A0ACC0WNJ1_9STRA|nr:hypothetical protein PsorP6_015956 [Peronosclerospora sorghi]